jgi:hypothetical protein
MQFFQFLAIKKNEIPHYFLKSPNEEKNSKHKGQWLCGWA